MSERMFYTKHFHIAKKNEINMIKNRNKYVISSDVEKILTMKKDEFNLYYKNTPNLEHYYPTRDAGEDGLFVIYFLESNKKLKTGVDTIHLLVKKLQDVKCSNILIVFLNPLGKDAENTLKALKTIKKQVFIIEELLFSPVERVDYNKHICMSENEKLNFFKEMKVDENSLPVILSTDPIVKYFNFPTKSVIKIIRNDHALNVLSKVTIFYRIVK